MVQNISLLPLVVKLQSYHFKKISRFHKNSVVPIGYLLNLKDNRHKNILHLQMALTSRVFGVSCTAGYQEVSKIMLGYHRTKKQKKKPSFGPCQKRKFSILYVDVPATLKKSSLYNHIFLCPFCRGDKTSSCCFFFETDLQR